MSESNPLPACLSHLAQRDAGVLREYSKFLNGLFIEHGIDFQIEDISSEPLSDAAGPPEDPRFKLFGVAKMGPDTNGSINQGDLETSARTFLPLIRHLCFLPIDARLGALGSMVMTFCCSCDEPEALFEEMVQEWRRVLPEMIAQRDAVRQ